MKRMIIAVSILTLGSMAGVASAQTQPAPRPAPTRARPAQPGAATTAPAAPRVRNYDFDADFIDGELVRPEGEFLGARRAAEHGSLIRVRTDFIREIVKSAEDL
jgi:hypothetical protein